MPDANAMHAITITILYECHMRVCDVCDVSYAKCRSRYAMLVRVLMSLQESPDPLRSVFSGPNFRDPESTPN